MGIVANGRLWIRQLRSCLFINWKEVRGSWKVLAFLFLGVAGWALFSSIHTAFTVERQDECFLPPVALPSGGVAPFMQSMMCGAGVKCSTRKLDRDPTKRFGESVFPRVWEDVLPLMSNKTKVVALVEVIRKLEFLLDVPIKWRNDTVKDEMLTAFDEMSFMVRYDSTGLKADFVFLASRLQRTRS